MCVCVFAALTTTESPKINPMVLDLAKSTVLSNAKLPQVANILNNWGKDRNHSRMWCIAFVSLRLSVWLFWLGFSGYRLPKGSIDMGFDEVWVYIA